MNPVSLDPAQFSCSICLELLQDPVTIPCGHSYCMSCLIHYWDHQEVCSCPVCRVTFSPRPVLGRNTLLHDTIQSLRAVKLGPSAPPMDLAPPGAAGFEHATFDIGSVRSQMNDGESRLQETLRRRLAQQILQKETEMEKLKQDIKTFSRATKAAVKDVSRIFSELQNFLESRRVEMKQLIRAQEKSEVTRAEHVMQELERQVAELKRLAHVPDADLPVQLPADRFPLVVSAPVSFLDVRNTVSDLKEELQSVYQSWFPRVTTAVRDVCVLQDSGEHVMTSSQSPDCSLDSRSELQQYLRPLTLDLFSAHRELRLREGNRVVERSGELQPYPDHPDRFDSWVQVLCREGLRGRSYWEAEWSGQQVVLGLAYQSIQRKGSSNGSRLGHNSASWCLKCSGSSVVFVHGVEEQTLAPTVALNRIGVFLDHQAGLICFYAVTQGDIRLLHRVAGHFTEPLYPAMWVGTQTSVRLCSLV